MKKTKKLIVVILATVMLLSTNTSAFATNAYLDNTPYVFELTPNSDEWSTYENKSDILTRLQIPTDKLKSMTTEALLTTVLNYPYILDYNFFNSPQDAYEVFYNDFNGFRELLSRSNLTAVLIDEYENAEVLSREQYILATTTKSKEDSDLAKSFFYTTTLEFLLVCDETHNGDFSNQQREYISTMVAVKSNNRVNSGLYSKNANIYNNYKTTSMFQASTRAGEYYTTTIYVNTPNGTSVLTFYDQYPELTSAEIQQINQMVRSSYPTAEHLSTATVKYNCHSYAWYSQTTTNKNWMPNPSAYMSDGSYNKITSSPRSGMKAFWKTGNHSGVITSITYSGGTHTYYVTSKWGSAGLYEHPLYNCPYSGIVNFYSRT